MAKFMRFPGAAWRKFMRKVREKGELTFFKGLSIPLSASDEPVETRAGYDVSCKEPFYESNPEVLFSWYRSYAQSREAKYSLTYADVVAFRTAECKPIAGSLVVDFSSVKIQLDGVKWKVPSKLHQHAEHAVALFKEKGLIKKIRGTEEYENNTTMRIDSIDSSGVIRAHPASYFDQVGTNITLDWNSGLLEKPATTIRNGEERPLDHKLHPLESSVLANTLGVAVVFYDRGLSPDIRLRTDDLASIQKKGLHCTSSGVWELPGNYHAGEFNASYLEYGARKEIKDEVGLNPDEYALFPVCIARELPRGGKPQIFFVAISLISAERYEEAKRTADESYEFVDDPDAMKRLQESSAPPHEAFTYEGWAAVTFANEFVEANEEYLRTLVKPA